MKNTKRLLALAVSAALTAPMSAFATNGMLLEGYGPIATGMGGASMAYDNGTAAMMNNPATLGLMGEGSRFDLALGHMAPDVTFDGSAVGMDKYKSKANSFFMPAIGWVKKDGDMVYGIGVFAQGGMGVDFRGVGGMGDNGNMFSQVSVGRLILPFAYNVNEKLSLGATIEYVWANLDLQAFDTDGASYAAGFKFKDSSDFTGEASASGFAGKLGLVYQVNGQFNIGAAYHSRGNLGDLTGASGNMWYMDFVDPDNNFDMPAKFKFKGFDMPAVIALGMSFQPSDRLMIAADVKQIQWSDTMKTPSLISSLDPDNPMQFEQKWKDQNVLSIGAAYQFNDAFVGRIGANIADNPVPDSTLNPLFPATVKSHYTLGFGYNFNDKQSMDFSLAHAPSTTATASADNMMPGMKVKHGQTNWQLMYSHRF